MQAFVPKNRRPSFELQLKLVDLNNIPLVSGTAYVKWHISMTTSAEHRGHTEKANISDHKVIWNYEKTVSLRLTVDKANVLQDSDLCLEILQEYSPSAKTERIALGNIRLNLAEYVGDYEEAGEGILRRYLMQDSKINSTLKVGIRMRQVDGDRSFIAPQLKTAPVFEGIAGLAVGDVADTEGPEQMPSMSSKARETGRLHDMYRQNLAATWAIQVGELAPDECIENIFAGGDGWDHRHDSLLQRSENAADEHTDHLRTPRRHQRKSSNGTIKPLRHKRHGKSDSGISGRLSLDPEPHGASESSSLNFPGRGELNEFNVREDLREWTIRVCP